MRRTIGLSALALIAGIALVSDGGWLANAQQQTIKRTDLLKVDLPEIKGSQMKSLGCRHRTWWGNRTTYSSDTEVRLCLEGAVTLEMDGKPSQTFKAGQAFVEMPNMVHNLKTRARPSRPKVLVSNTQPKARRFNSTPLKPGSRSRSSLPATVGVAGSKPG